MSETVFHQKGFQARFEWGQEGVQELAPHSDLIVVVDVLSFTTCVSVAVAQGAIVFPFREKSAAAKLYAEQVNAVLAGKRGEVPSLSPESLMGLTKGARIVLPSLNGSTCTVMAVEKGAQVVAGSLRNAAAVASFAKQRGGVVSVIACGERWEHNDALRPAFEDLVGAGAILSHFDDAELSPEARAAVAVFKSVQGDLLRHLQECSSGRELIEKGFPQDVAMAAQLDATVIVPYLEKDAYRPLKMEEMQMGQ